VNRRHAFLKRFGHRRRALGKRFEGRGSALTPALGRRGLQMVAGLHQPVQRHAGQLVVLLAVILGAEVRIGQAPH
jgi:hypothetical protein